MVRYDWGNGSKAEYQGPRPIHNISTDQYTELLAHAKEFYDYHDPAKTAIIQLVSSRIEENDSLLQPWQDNSCHHMHCFVRIIMPDGNLYSIGAEPDGRGFRSNFIQNATTTVDGSICQFDFDEFRSYKTDMMVTSIPITPDTANAVLSHISDIQRHIRFCFMYQNCSTVAGGIMQMAGIEMPERKFVLSYFFSIIAPDLTKIPFIGPVIGRVYGVALSYFSFIWNYHPDVQRVLSFTATIILYIPKKICVVFFNTIILLGGCTYGGDLPEHFEEQPLDDHTDLRPKNFSRLFRSFTDLFNDEICYVSHIQFIVNWQKEQSTTRVHIHSDKPFLRVMPQFGTRV